MEWGDCDKCDLVRLSVEEQCFRPHAKWEDHDKSREGALSDHGSVIVHRFVCTGRDGLCRSMWSGGTVYPVGGIGGVATAFAARDILGNMLSEVSLQFSRPFIVGDSISAGDL